MFHSIFLIYLAAQAFSTVALAQSCSCCFLTPSQNQRRAQAHINEDLSAVATDQNTSYFPLGGLGCLISACTKTSSSGNARAQTQPQQQEGETTKEKSNVTPESSDEDDYILDESGCPELAKNVFYCLMCGGSDENGKCKGVSGISITLAVTAARLLVHAIPGSRV